ncbi:WbqC family protein [uncultured Bifidobacterium sp.]|uniref:WbqC family protein n=1 Tax=uncultured Bifidobacterium sp. TaxID=165187 RepID=UPI002594D78A|nr:WbqC family protein [uncultured Bifidobacterium sp.]
MKLGVMQPYFLPYLGYWQLMNLVDVYVIFDDVNYIKRGWIARNRIKMNGEAVRFGFQVSHASQNRRICDHERAGGPDEIRRMERELHTAYAHAPQFERVMPVMETILRNPQRNLADWLCDSIYRIAEYAGIHTVFMRSSEIEYDRIGNGQDKILSLCEVLGATTYINAIGGRGLYVRDRFASRGIDLRFLEMNDVTYPQGPGEFIPSMSIVDVMMWNGPEDMRRLLTEYTLRD